MKIQKVVEVCFSQKIVKVDGEEAIMIVLKSLPVVQMRFKRVQRERRKERVTPRRHQKKRLIAS